MGKDLNLFVIIIGCIFFIIGAYYWIIPKLSIKDPKSTRGIIILTDTAVPEQMKKNNSRWAFIEINIDGERYISGKRLQVPMHNKIGDFIEVIYDEKNPENMVIQKRAHIVIIFVFIGIMLITYEVYLKRMF